MIVLLLIVSPASGDQIELVQKIEGQNLQYLKKGTSSAESLLLSFWVYLIKQELILLNYIDKDNTRHHLQNHIQFHLLILGKRKQ